MKKLFIFLTGVATGSLITWKFVENKYSKIANDEIQSVMDRFSKYNENNNENDIISEEDIINEEDIVNEEENRPTVFNIDTHIDEYNNIYDLNDVEEDAESYAAPYVISESEFAENDDYEIITFIYYEDNMLADEDDILIVDPENLVGDALNTFIYNKTEDSIYVRNEKTKCDYEILRSEKKYSEISSNELEDK